MPTRVAERRKETRRESWREIETDRNAIFRDADSLIYFNYNNRRCSLCDIVIKLAKPSLHLHIFRKQREMARTSSPPPDIVAADEETSSSYGLGLRSIRGRFIFKRNQQPQSQQNKDQNKNADRQWRNNRSQQGRVRRASPYVYVLIIIVVFIYALASLLLQSSITSVFIQSESRKSIRHGLKFGSSLKFVPYGLLQRFSQRRGLDQLRTEARLANRAPRLALVSVHWISY